MKLENRIVFALVIFVLIGSIANWAYFWGSLQTMRYFPTEFHEELLSLRFCVSIGFLILLIGILSKRLWGKILSIASLLLISVFYAHWFFEKYRWLEGRGKTEGTIEYTDSLGEIGWFRDANSWDYVALFAVLFFLVWTLFKLKGPKHPFE
ncbi:MAG: hypothetical protein WBD22_01925 [Pyrinomonadaceae bacterium]